MPKTPDRPASVSGEQSITQRRKLERERLDGPFWFAAVNILNTRDTAVLRDNVFAIADSVPQVSLPVVGAVVRTLEEQYEGPRKFTDEAEINHAYQVTILSAHAVGWRRLSLGTFVTALGHDYHENTPHHPSDSPHALSEVADGIVALSHKDDGEPLYPEPNDKTPYFDEIIKVHRNNPDLELVTIKIADQIAVANSPLTKDALKEPELEERWKKLSKGKVDKEMKLFLALLRKNNQDGLLDKEIQLLQEAIDFTERRMEAHEEKQTIEHVLFNMHNWE
ncbi:MAG: hypothetical protein ACR2LN_03075 [Candidatus Levyibacteriota bacterium]